MKFLYGLILFILIWWIFSIIIDSQLILPTPISVGRVFIDLVQTKTLWSSLLSTVLKGIIALAFTIILGFFFGFLMGIFDMLYELFRPAFTIFQSVPVISWLVLVIFVWGIGFKGPIVITVLSLLPNTTFAIAQGVKNTDKKLIEMAYVYNVPKKRIVKDIYIGSVIPFLFTALEVISGNIWKVIIVSEYLAGNEGIGVQIAWARQYVNVPKVYALTIFAILLGISSERLIKFIIKRKEFYYAS